jgi:hypothetical protein
MPLIDTSRETVTVAIYCAGQNITPYAVFRECSFTANASAMPGTCQVVCRDPTNILSFVEGSLLVLKINGEIAWQGYVLTIDQGYIFPDAFGRRWTLHGVDLNILFDKLVLYNHTSPTKRPDGGGTYQVVDGVVSVPQHTTDKEYIEAMLADFDLDLVSPTIQTRITEVGQVNPDAEFTPPNAGTTLRGFMADVSGSVQKSTPGSSIWYLSPDAYLVYQEQDQTDAPFSVGDDGSGVNVKDLSIASDISRIKNDVLIFTGNLNPTPSSEQEQFLFRHAFQVASIEQYGRFQYAEVIPSWSAAAIRARANMLLYQEGDPAKRAEFTTFRAGLFPGQIVNISSSTHGILENFPIRSMEMTFPVPDMVQYRVMCSYDTQDPWGLLLALKRPPTRGLIQPRFNAIDLTEGDVAKTAEPFTFVREFPAAIGGNKYQCSYAYIRYSITVFYDNLRQISFNEAGTVGFTETGPETGQFQLGFTPSAGKKVYVEYHVMKNLQEQ